MLNILSIKYSRKYNNCLITWLINGKMHVIWWYFISFNVHWCHVWRKCTPLRFVLYNPPSYDIVKLLCIKASKKTGISYKQQSRGRWCAWVWISPSPRTLQWVTTLPISECAIPNSGKVGNQVLCLHSWCFGSYFYVIFSMYLVSCFYFKPIVRQSTWKFWPNLKLNDKVFFSFDYSSIGSQWTIPGGWHVATLEQFEIFKMAARYVKKYIMVLNCIQILYILHQWCDLIS